MEQTLALSGRRCQFAALVLGLAALQPLLVAQSAVGTVSGYVSEAATGNAISNAIISVDDSPVTAATGFAGTYSLQLPSGVHRLDVRYVGMEELKQTITVIAGQTATHNFALISEVHRLDAIVVRALRAGQAAAIHEERHAPNVRTVAEIDAFGNPGGSAGELLQRLAGVAVDGSSGKVDSIYVRGMGQDFSSLLIDGNQIATSGGSSVGNSNVYFGQVNTGNISSLEIIKAATPEMDGNAIAGYVNLRTRRTFERAGRSGTVTVGAAWADNREDASMPGRNRPGLNLISLSYADVLSILGGKNNLGIAASASRNSWAHNTTPEFGYQSAAAPQTAFVVPIAAAGTNPDLLQRAFGAGEWGAISLGQASSELNLGFNADYKLSDRTTLFLRSTYSRMDRNGASPPSYFRWKLVAPNTAASLVSGSTYDLLEARNGTLTLESVLYTRNSESTALSGGLEHKFLTDTAKLSADFNYSKNRTGYPKLNQVFAQITGVGWQLDRRGRDPWLPLVRQTAGPDWSDPASYSIRSDSQQYSYSAPAERSGGRVDLEKAFFGPWPFTVKAGIKQSNYQQKANRDLNYFTYAGPATTSATGGTKQFVGANMKLSRGNYGPFPFLQLPTTGMPGDAWAEAANWRQTSSDVWNTIYQSNLNDVEYSEDIYAGYLQGSAKLGRLRVLTGFRWEETQTSGSSFLRVSNTTNNNQGTMPMDVNAARARDNFRGLTTQGTKYRNTFPGVHLVFPVGANSQARASYNVTITRPSPVNLLPNIVPNENNQTLSAGNPALRPYTSDNFDVSFAHFFSGIGQLLAGAFLKEITNYFRSMQSTVGTGPNNGFNGEYAGWTITQNRNTGSARIRGLEFNYQQQYTFLPGFWRGFGSFANYTYLETWGDFGSATGFTSKLPNLTPHSYNAGLTYADRGFTLRLLANYRSEYYRSSTSGTFGTGVGVTPGSGIFEVYRHSRVLVDLKFQYSFGSRYVLLFDAYNLTGELGTSDYAHFLGHEVPTYGSGPGTTYKIALTTRF